MIVVIELCLRVKDHMGYKGKPWVSLEGVGDGLARSFLAGSERMFLWIYFLLGWRSNGRRSTYSQEACVNSSSRGIELEIRCHRPIVSPREYLISRR